MSRTNLRLEKMRVHLGRSRPRLAVETSARASRRRASGAHLDETRRGRVCAGVGKVGCVRELTAASRTAIV